MDTVTADAEHTETTADLGEAAELISDAQPPATGQEVAHYQPRALLPAPLARLKEVAGVLAGSMNVPVSFQGDERKCLAIAYQAALWGMDPVAVASKCYVTPVKGGGERLCYEAQLIAALINRNAPLRRAPTIAYARQGAQRFCVVTGTRPDGETIQVSSPTIAQITVKNSPLWFTDPDQQLAYYTLRSFARRYFPEVIMGVYSIDEMRVVQIEDVTPRRDPFDDTGEEAPEIEAELEPSGGSAAAEAAGKKGAKTKAEPSGGDGRPAEPEDMPELRAWAGEVQAAILALGNVKDIAENAQAMNDDERWNRFIAYASAEGAKINASIRARIAELKAAAKKAG